MAQPDRPSGSKDDVDTIEIQKPLKDENGDAEAKKSELDNLGIWATVKRFKKASTTF